MLNKANKIAANLASENGQADVAKFISVSKCKYSKKLRSMTLDTVKYGADDGGKDEAKVLLLTAAEVGNTHVTVCEGILLGLVTEFYRDRVLPWLRTGT